MKGILSLVIGVILLLLPLSSFSLVVAHPVLRVTITPTIFNYLPFVAKNWSASPTPPSTPTPTATATPTSTSTATSTPTATPTDTPMATLIPTHTPTTTSTPVWECSTTPTLLAPADGSALNTLIPLFEWDSGNNPNVTEFYLEVGLDPALTHWVYGLRCSSAACQTGINQWRINRNLDPATLHYWRAYLLCGSTRGPYSEVWSFTTGSGGATLPGPSLISPADGTTLPGTSVLLEWSAVNGAVEYWVWFSGDMDYGTRVQDTAVTLRGLQADTSFEWWVQARNDYALGADSTHWHFTTGMSGSSVLLNWSSSLLSYGRDHVEEEGKGTTVIFEQPRPK